MQIRQFRCPSDSSLISSNLGVTELHRGWTAVLVTVPSGKVVIALMKVVLEHVRTLDFI
jgi:hypothetical protein